MLHETDRKLITEDGAEYLGYGFGAKKDAVLECAAAQVITRAIAEKHGFQKVGEAGGLELYRRNRHR